MPNVNTNQSVVEFMELFGQTPDLQAMRPEGAGVLTETEAQEYLLRANASKAALFFGDDPTERKEKIQFAAARFMEAVTQGKLGGKPLTRLGRQEYLRQAMSYGDFPDLFGYVLDRQVLPMFERASSLSSVLRIARRTTLRDFKEVERHRRAGGRGEMKIQNEGQPVQSDDIKAYKSTYRPYLYSKQFPIYWQSFVNDDIGIFDDLTDRIVDSALETLELFVTRLIADENGWLASAFIGDTATPDSPSGTSGAAIGGGSLGGTANDPLAESSLEDGFSIMSKFKDRGGQVPIAVIPRFLMISPANQLNARSLLRSVNMITGEVATRPELNKVGGLMTEDSIIVNRHLPLVATTATAARVDAMWAIFAEATNRIAFLEIGGLQDFDAPRVFVKMSDNSSTGGAPMPWTFGDFETNTARMKAMIGFGGTRLDGEGGYANNGDA